MARIQRSSEATSDLLDIFVRLKESRGDDAASKMMQTISRKIRTLSTQPLMGRQRDEIAAGLRSFPVPPYVVFYRPLEDGIAIVRVIHERRDLETLFDDPGL